MRAKKHASKEEISKWKTKEKEILWKPAHEERSQKACESSSESEGDKNHVESAGATEPDNFKSLPASVRKLKGQSSDSSEDYSSKDEIEAALEGFRVVHISVLASVLECLWCPFCKQGHVLEKMQKLKSVWRRFGH